MPSNDSRKILIIAAEASSCLYAQRLLQHWKREGVEVEAFGVGNEAMAREGFECIGRAEELAVVGFSEVVSHWRVIKKAADELTAAARDRRPNVVLLLDYPGFNLRFAARMKKLGIPVVYYISPQVWAWKEGRVKTIKQIIDKMLVVFPFEVDFYAGHDMKVDFVGNPLLDEIDPKHFNTANHQIHRAKYGVQNNEILLALMPGSRNSELNYHLPIQLETARLLLARFPNLKIAMFVAPNFTKEEVQARLGELDFPMVLIKDEPFAMIELADVVLVASGTATLMVGLLEKPMVIMYRVSAFTAWLAKKFVKSTKYFGLINLVLDDLVAPEIFQAQATPENLMRELAPLVNDAGSREAMRAKLSEAKDRLGSKGATVRVAAALEEYWSKST